MREKPIVICTILFVAITLLGSEHARAGLNKLIEKNVENAQESYQRTLSGDQSVLSPARLWVHIRKNDQKRLAEELMQIVTAADPGQREIQTRPVQVVEIGPDNSQLRFFKRSDRDDARALAELLRRYVPGILLLDLSRQYEGVKWLDAGHYELWLSGDVGSLAVPE